MTRILADISVSLDGLTPGVLRAGPPPFTGGAPRAPVRRSVLSTSTAAHLSHDISG